MFQRYVIKGIDSGIEPITYSLLRYCFIGEDGERQCPTCNCNPCSAGAVGGTLGGILVLLLIVNIVITINFV